MFPFVFLILIGNCENWNSIQFILSFHFKNAFLTAIYKVFPQTEINIFQTSFENSSLFAGFSSNQPSNNCHCLTKPVGACRGRMGLAINNSDSWVISVGSSKGNIAFVLQSTIVLLGLQVASFWEEYQIPFQSVFFFLLSRHGRSCPGSQWPLPGWRGRFPSHLLPVGEGLLWSSSAHVMWTLPTGISSTVCSRNTSPAWW